MNSTNPELQPLTIGHGRKLFEKSKEISQQLGKLAPLLTLLESPNQPEDQDPIGAVLKFIETLATLSEHQTIVLAEIDAKLDILLASSNTERA
jgi:hypothetical protein